MTEAIEIRYDGTPRGQVGPRPRKVALNGTFRVVCSDPVDNGSIQFLGQTPLEDGKMTAGMNEDLKAAKTGRFAFTCTVVRKGKPVTIGMPDDGTIGGEIEVIG
jgi:hypothetical protein